MELKDVILILSPVATVLVAAGTIIFNVFDRRRSIQLERAKLDLERQKIAQEMARLFLSGSATLERRADFYGRIMKLVSDISELCHNFDRSVQLGGSVEWDHEAVKCAIDEVLKECRSNQALTNKVIHETLARKYAPDVLEKSVEISEQVHGIGAFERDYSLNLSAQIVAQGDYVKDQLRDDLENFVLSVGRLPS